MNKRAVFNLLAALMVSVGGSMYPDAALSQTWIDKQDPTPGMPVRNDNPDINFRSSEHFRIRWGKNNVTTHPIDEQFVQLNLQNAERHWKVMHDAFDPANPLTSAGLGFPSPSVKWSGYDGYNYRANWNIGQTDGNPNGGGAGGGVDGDGIATYGMGPWALDPFAPTSVVSHEYGHGILIAMKGLNNTPYDGMWHEGWANFSTEQIVNDWDPTNMLYCHAFFLPHGRDYYDSWIFWEHLRETPGYGPAFLSTLFTQCKGSASEYVFDAMTRLDPSGSLDHQNAIKDLVGRYAAKNVTWDYERGDMMRNYSFLPSFTDPLSDKYRKVITEAVRETGSTTVYRVPFDQAPSQGGYVVIPLNVTGNTAGGFSVGINFMPLSDGVRQSDWRATLVAVNTNGEPRYSSMWNCGTNTIVLSKDEKKLYMVVAATPSFLGCVDRSFLYQPSIAPQAFEFSLVNTSATIYETKAQYASTGLTQVANGKGYRATTATVASTAYVGPNARVLGTAQILGNARIEDYAVVQGSAVVKDNAVVSGHALVQGSAQVYGNAKVRDWATISGSVQVYENGKVLEHATLIETVKVHGNAVEKGITSDFGAADVSGYAIKEGDCSNGVNIDHGVLMCWVWGFDQAFADSQPDTAGLYAGYNFEKASPIYAMDTYGIIHGYLMGGASRVKINDTNRSYAMQFDGTSKYVELHNDVNDFKDSTIACWVYWTGSADDQRIFSFGDGSSKYMYLTPKDATTGNMRLVVTNGTTTQYVDGTAPLAANRWTHIAVTFTDSTLTYTAYVASPYAASSNKWTATATMYVDGVAGTPVSGILVPDQVNGANVLAGGNFNFLGKGPAGNFFQGYIDDFRVYSQAQTSIVIAALAGQVSNRSAGLVAETDTTAPTPSTATWLVAPTVGEDGTSITMSANKGTDTNGVLYNFVCTAGGGDSSGWISSNKYTDNGLTAGATYTYTIQMRDCLGNSGTVSSEASATTAAADTTVPSPNPATFAIPPRGISTTSISITATKGTDASGPVEYLFTKVSGTGGVSNSGWQSSPKYTFTGTSGYSYTFSVQMRDGKGNTGTVSATSASAIAKDYTPPTVTSVARAVWQARPYAMIDNTFWMRARYTGTSTDQYYYHCSAVNGVAQPDPSPYDSGWKSATSNNAEWRSTIPVADGTYTWQYKVKDNSAQANTTPYMGTIDVVVGPKTGYHSYAMSQLAAVPDDYLVSFNGAVLEVNSNNYVVKDMTSGASITVKPNTVLEVTDSALLFKNVTVKGHIYTYSGTRVITSAVLTSTGNTTMYAISGKVTSADGAAMPGATVYVSDTANATANSTTTVTTDASGNYTVSVPAGNWHVAAGADNYYSSSDQVVTVNGANVPNVNFTITAMPSISGQVTDVSGAGVAGVTVCIATTSGNSANPAFCATTDASGNYIKGVDNGTYYVSAYGSAYSISAERMTTVSSNAVTGIDLTVKAYTTSPALVSLDPAALATGTLTTWNNDGTLGGSFSNENTTPIVETLLGKKCVTFDGYDKMKSTFNVPAGITGTGNWSVECWAYNAAIAGEECMVSWADRSGSSRAMQFNYGSASGWGAATHMNNDLGWTGAIAPTAGAWHHLVLTYSGGTNGTEKVYVDGALNNTATKTLNLFANEPMFLACAFNSNLSTGWNLSGSLAGVRVTDDVMTLANIQDVYIHSGISTYAVSGTVTSVSGTPLSGATVYFSKSAGPAAHPDATVTTDANGNYSLALSTGTWYLAVSKTGYATSGDRSLSVSNASLTGVNIQLGTANLTITASAGTGGMINPVGSVFVPSGGSQVFTITPISGYGIDTVTVDGASQGAVGSFTFANVTVDHTISATFKGLTYPDHLAYYTFDETSGLTARDWSGHSYNGTLNGGATWNTGKYGNALDLNGTDGYVTLPAGIVSSVNDFTISTWVNLRANTNWNRIFDFGSGSGSYMYICLRGTSGIRYAIKPSSGGEQTCDFTTAFTTGAWKHIAVTQSGNIVTIYIDGVKVAQNTNITVKPSSLGATTQTWIGRSQFSDPYLNGQLDDFRIYSRALSAAEITNLFNFNGTYTITASAGAGGTISPSGSVVVNEGFGQTYTITPNAGYAISQVTVDGVNQGAIASYSFGGITANHTISATFSQIKRTITASVGANGSVTPSGAVSVNYGANQVFTFSPSAGYGMVSLKVDGASITPAASYTFTNVIADHSISATFAKLIGINNKTALTDSKVIGRVVKVWGNIKSVNGTTSFTIDDGNGSPLTVNVNGAYLSVGIAATKTAVVTGVVDANKNIQAQSITIVP